MFLGAHVVQGMVVNALVLHQVTNLCVPCNVGKYQGYCQHCVIFLQHLQQVCLLVEVEMCEVVHDIADVCPLIFGVKNFGGITA